MKTVEVSKLNIDMAKVADFKVVESRVTDDRLIYSATGQWIDIK
jgi:hypothetical protein